MASKHSGMTLMEILMVVAIIGILTTLGYPHYTRYITESRRTDAMAFLLEAMQRQERYFTEHLEYAQQLTRLGYSSNAVVTAGGAYQVSASACQVVGREACIRLIATPIGVQYRRDNGQALTLDSQGRRTGSWNE